MSKYAVDTSKSPFATMRPVPVTAVTLGPGFWQSRVERNRKVSIPQMYHALEAHGVMNNFRRTYGEYDGPREGLWFTDSDLYKWIEGACIALYAEDDPEIHTLIDQGIAILLPAQGEDGYLNTYQVDERADMRWQNLPVDHEMYCAGHLIQAAVAHHRLTGERTLLDCATRFADYIDDTFRVADRPGTDGHPEVEMALIELYRETGEERYLALAGRFLEQCGVVNRTKILGHAVRAGYFMTGAMDYYLETGNPDNLQAIQSQWQDMTQRKTYITGGIGSRYTAESFGEAYELPNERAYTETCAAISAVFWNWRMMQQSSESTLYADAFEHTLYNGFLSGVSLSGEDYFYVNPLANSGQAEDDPWYVWARKGPFVREPWHYCTCCPPNVQRLIASLPGHFYSTSADGIWVHLYDNNTLEMSLDDGTAVSIVQTTNYPWEGQVRMQVTSDGKRPFSLHLRIPGWARSANVKLNGEVIADAAPGTYLQIHQVWNNDLIELEFETKIELVASHDLLTANRGALAVVRGPLVYCLEGADHDGVDVRRLQLDRSRELTATQRAELLDGVTTIEANGCYVTNYDTQPLYHAIDEAPVNETVDRPLTFIPYYTWANRGANSMTVWVPYAD